MLKTKLPMRTAEAGDDTAEEQPDLHIPRSVSPTISDRLEDSSRHPGYPSQLDKETVFEWFGLHLNPAKRIELMCGLLHMCQPLELRFLGSCLEDLARKDYPILRDVEIRANCPNDLGILSDVIDPVVRSKLLVCLSLLRSDSRECAGILFRILSHMDPALFYKNYPGYSVSPFRDPLHPSCVDGKAFRRTDHICGRPMEAAVGPLEQLALLFTMASLHPAFPFHQRETLLVQLDKIELATEDRQQNQYRINAQAQKAEYLGPAAVTTEASLDERTQGQRQCASQTPPSCTTQQGSRTQREAVHIEKIVLKGMSQSRTDREYNFEVKWSDSSSSNVRKTQLELEGFLLKLPKEHSTESFEKGILRLLNQGDKYESRGVERNLKEKFLSAPQAFRQTRKVCGFFLCESSSSSSCSCSRCNPAALGKPFKEDGSEASSQEEVVYLDPYVQGHRKKHVSNSPCLSIPDAKSSQGESIQKGSHSSKHNSLPDWRRKTCTLQPDQEASGGPGPEQHQDSEKRANHPASMRQPLGPDRWDRAVCSVMAIASSVDLLGREKGKKAYLANGSMVPPASQRARQSTGKDGDSSHEVYGETSSESYSSASSPQHHKPESLDSEDEKDKDTGSSQGPADAFFPWQEVVDGAMPPIHHLVSAKPVGEPPSLDYPPNTFMHPLPCILPNRALPADAPLPVMPPQVAAALVDNKVVGGLIMQVPLVLREPMSTTVPGDPEQRDAPAAVPMVLPGFGSLALGVHPPGSPALLPLVQHFKTAPPQTTASSEGVTTLPAYQPLVEAISVITPGPPYASPLQPAYSNPDPASPLTPSVPLGDLSIPHTKHPDVSLFSGLPSLYTMAPIPTSVMATLGVAPSPGQVQAVVPPSVPTHTPGPAPGSTQTDSTSYVNSTSNSVAQQQAQPQHQQQQQQQTTHQQQAMCCGACGCRGGCGNSRTAPSFFFPHQMAPRQVFGAPPIFQFTSLCTSNYLSQPPPQSNGQAQLTFFPPAPYAGQTLLHTHPHSDLGTQLGYSLQQMVSPFNRFYPHIYPSSVGMVPGSGGLGGAVGVNKNNGNVSCYNCGVSGHYAQDCKQPSVDSTQQGSFRLKYATSHSSEGLDNAS
ncbi:zinc finger CCHC domain-containing protein 2-like isoform X3 [Salvelinus namaycush]|uniref:Zinc finger CCHC domain-containing protein 2-like isoform X3 n=1 Tax=Salvelinus namaycush TaxID=8040 RepID=A0A8U0PMZ5_SALNM|nr:zinc finger CCHC domain-containing protein 2-like isoform X3 [Salvelinus namaycush]